MNNPSEFQFKNLKGEPLNYNPHEKIVLANRSATEKIDYRAFHPVTHTGIVELWGKRSFQEDRISLNVVKAFSTLSNEQKKEVLIQVIDRLQTLITTKGIEGGSTLLATFIDHNNLYTLNVGDSTGFFIQLNEKGEVITFFRLNRLLHNPEYEMSRLKPAYVRHQRLAGSLLLSRAMGDNEFEQFGLLHQPEEIYHDEIEFLEKTFSYVIVACDGLTEGDCLDQTEIAHIVSTQYQNPPDQIATELALAAYRAGSSDNISVMVTPVQLDEPAKYLALFDGHGGDAVSSFLSIEFYSVLKKYF